jgi:hypothetical protein
VPPLDELETPGVRGFFARQHREEGLTSNWFRALAIDHHQVAELRTSPGGGATEHW